MHEAESQLRNLLFFFWSTVRWQGIKKISLCLENMKGRCKRLGDTKMLHLRPSDVGHQTIKRLLSFTVPRKTF